MICADCGKQILGVTGHVCKPVSNLKITSTIGWEDPESDPIAAIRQIQEFLDELVVSGKI